MSLNMQTPNCNQRLSPSRCRGATLVEVLISVLVLAVGLLGVVAMQMSSMRNQNEAQNRTLAIQQINDMSERMRANMTGVIAGGYVNIAGVVADPGCITTGCTPLQVAQYDAYRWIVDTVGMLPNAVPTVAGPGPDGAYLIRIQWDRRDGSTENLLMSVVP